jgi:O-antigen/teichoic acid export membrane protein
LQPGSEQLAADGRPSRRESLTSHTVRGLKWSYVATAASIVLQLAFTAIVSRRLDPTAFGLLALANLVLRFTTYFSQMGITSAIVQRPELDGLMIRCAFTISSLVSLCFFALTFALAPVAASVFDQPELTAVVRWLGVTLLISGLGAASAGLLQRAMQFRFIAAAEVGSYAVAYTGVGLVLAVHGAGVWSLVVAAVLQTALLAMIKYLAVRHSLRPSLERTRSRSLVSFGGSVSLVGFTEFLGGNFDTLAVGRYYGAAALGQYSRANMVAALPAHHASSGLTRVLLPAISRVQSDRAKVAGVFVAGVTFSNALVFPMCAAIALTSRDLVRVLLGPQWQASGEILPFIALALAFDYTILVPAIIFEAQRRLGTKLLIQTAHLAAVIIAVCISVALGLDLVGLAACWAAAQGFRHLLYLITSTRALHPDRARLARAYADALLLTGVPALLMLLTGCVLSGSSSPVRLAGEAVVGLAAYLALIAAIPALLVRREASERDLVRLVLNRAGNPPNIPPPTDTPVGGGTGLEAGQFP